MNTRSGRTGYGDSPTSRNERSPRRADDGKSPDRRFARREAGSFTRSGDRNTSTAQLRAAPEGSEQWVRPWVQLKYFTYNPAVFPRMLGASSPDAAAGGLINVYDKNGEFFGSGFWNPRSRTPLRMLRHGSEPLSEEDLEEALRRAVA